MMKSSRGKVIVSVLTFGLVLAITVLLFVLRNRIAHIQVYGYPVVFLLSILANATLILPLPGVALASLLGANPSFNPLLVAIVVGVGSAIGEMTGYLAGFSGQIVVEKSVWYYRIQDWMARYGPAAVFILAFVPNPFFDMAGISAGASKMPIPKFLFWCSLGKILKMMIFAFAGATILKMFPWLVQ
jgi:membrane protein DedA with SNARE-associated domain